MGITKLAACYLLATLSALPAWGSSPTPPKALAAQALEAFAFEFPKDNPEKLQTNALLVLHRGEVIFEKYNGDFRASSRHLAWSVTKSLLNGILGAMVSDGWVKLQDTICKYYEVPHPNYCAISIEHLARHSSGLDWRETYEDDEQPKDSSIIALLYGEGIYDMAKFVLQHHKLKHTPGTKWRYSSGDSNLLASVLAKAMSNHAAKDYPFTRLFHPLGMESLLFERDARGVIVGSSYSYLTARDLARFGQLFLARGRWQGTQILPESWIDYSLTLAPAMKSTPQKIKAGRNPDAYGAHWWLNKPIPEQKLKAPWPGISERAFAALGHWGQYLLVNPEKELVIVRFGNDRGGRLDIEKLFALAAELAEAK